MIVPFVTPMTRKRKFIVSMATSADGFIARPDGSVDWLDRPHPKGNYGMAEFYRSIDTILWGRKTCELALEFQRKGVPGSAFDTKVKNYVFSRTLPKSAAPKGMEIVSDPVKDFASRVRAAEGQDIWIIGGAGLVGSFLDAGEIDEFILNVVPVFIGEGIPIVAQGRRTVALKLIESKEFSDGVVKLHYSAR